MTAQSGQSTNSIDHSVFIFQLLIVILVIVVTAAAASASAAAAAVVVVASALPCLHRPQFRLVFFNSWSSILYSCDTDFHQHQPHPGLAPGVHNVLFSFFSYLSSFVSPFSLCCVCVCVFVCASFPATITSVVSAHCCRRCYRSLKEASHTSSRRTRHGSFTSIWRTASSSHRTAALP